LTDEQRYQPIYTAAETAKFLDIPLRTFYRNVKAGVFVAHVPDLQPMRYSAADIDAFRDVLTPGPRWEQPTLPGLEHVIPLADLPFTKDMARDVAAVMDEQASKR